MKKLFTLFAIALMALTVKAQTEPLYTTTTKLAADQEWGDDYAPYFAFQGTEVNVEVYAEDYVIIKNWAGAEGCDLKVEYDPNIDINDENCMGNILAVTSIINGVEQEPLTYSKEVTDDEGNTYTVNYVDIKTGREDYPVCSTSLNEDGTLYWSFVEVDRENKTGYVELTAYFMTADYDVENLGGYYYYASWPEDDEPSGAVSYGTFDATVYDTYDEESTSFPAVEGITVEAFGDHVVVHNVGGVKGYDMTVTFDTDENVTSITPPTKTGEEGETVTSGYCSIYTGLDDANWRKFQAYLAPEYAYATANEKNGYVCLYGYNAANEYSYYYIYWGEDEADGINDVIANRQSLNGQSFNLAGQKVGKDFKGLVIKNGKKIIVRK